MAGDEFAGDRAIELLTKMLEVLEELQELTKEIRDVVTDTD